MMIARGALWDVSIFQKERTPIVDLVDEFLKLVSEHQTQSPLSLSLSPECFYAIGTSLLMDDGLDICDSVWIMKTSIRMPSTPRSVCWPRPTQKMNELIRSRQQRIFIKFGRDSLTLKRMGSSYPCLDTFDTNIAIPSLYAVRQWDWQNIGRNMKRNIVTCVNLTNESNNYYYIIRSVRH